MLTAIKLRDFLGAQSNTLRNLPFVHTTESSKLVGILNHQRLFATPCNIFQGEKLCYLFVARPAYKYDVPGGEAPYWMLPTVFVLRFQTAPRFKRIYPFDSGAFSRRRLPDYVTTFAREDFEIGQDIKVASALIDAFFGSDVRYWRKQASSEADFRDKYQMTALHMQVEALNRLYGERSNDFDDRAACIEAQLDRDIPLDPADVLGVVVPEEYLRDQRFKQALGSMTANICSYPVQPVSVTMYYSQIYNEVKTIYKKFGILQ